MDDSKFNEMKNIRLIDIIQELHNDWIIFCLSGVEDWTILWMLTDTKDKNWNAIQWYSKTVSLAIWSMAVEAMIYYPTSGFSKYFKTLQC